MNQEGYRDPTAERAVGNIRKTQGLRFPKQKIRKKRKAHKASILQQKDGTCYLCRKLHGDYSVKKGIHEHHVFDGNPNRSISEAEGFKVYLCTDHHLYGSEAVHRNHEMMLLVQQDCQREYEKTHTREEFMKKIGKNYLSEAI